MPTTARAPAAAEMPTLPADDLPVATAAEPAVAVPPTAPVGIAVAVRPIEL